MRRALFVAFLVAVLFLFLGLAGGSAWAQVQQDKDKENYRLVVDVDLVSVQVVVTTPQGAIVPNLKKEDFQIFEDGQPQEITLFGKESAQPLGLCLLFDSSFSILTELKTELEASSEFLQNILRPVDQVSVYQVSHEVRELVHSSSRIEPLTLALRSIKPEGGTSLYDAIAEASQNLAPIKGRKVIVAVTDGEDTTSKRSLQAALKLAMNSGAALYPLVVQPIKSEAGENLAGKHAMIYMAENTGGKYYLVGSMAALRASFAAISDELRTQYFLGYYPKHSNPSDGFHQITVQVGNPIYVVRTRNGYYSGR